MGDFKQFQYLERPNEPRTTFLTAAHYNKNVGTTDDPVWKIIRPDGSIGQREELEYWGTDGRIWYCKVHAKQYSLDGIEIWLSHTSKNGLFTISHDDSLDFAIRDWNNNPIEMKIDKLVPNDTAPGFIIRR